ncbi:MAG: hypothetical protein L0229_02765 [Blastocatellia bacterium]|nr:hypothetical protein [Blastocatellia bacterium]
MYRPTIFKKAGIWIALSLILISTALARPNGQSASKQTQTRRPRLIKAFIVDYRLSALRREPDMQSEVIKRLSIGRPVYIIGSKSGGEGQPRFYRVAVSRRTRGWIHESAIAVPGRAGEPERVMKLITDTRDGLNRIAICRLFIDRFGRSPLLPRAMFAMAEESDDAGTSLTRNARKRLAKVGEEGNDVDVRDYYLSDTGLDRYSRLHIKFDFNPDTNRYVYDGQAYRDIIKRFPDSDEAVRARVRLARMEKRLARR